ncbi:uncharacterized protein LOC144881039 isoform X2 [Branchiostoma floridae x Branchiostoma japonicum]
MFCVLQISQAFMSALFRVLGNYYLPPDNILPRSFREAKAIIEPLLTPMVKIEMCRNKCILFDGPNEHLDACPKCQAPRSPKYTYPYISIIERLKRWMSVPKLAELLQTHLPPVPNDDERMTDIQQSPAWKAFSERMGDTRCIGFGLNTDGVDPYNHQQVNYSIWQIILRVYNMPPEIRENFGFLMPTSAIPGPKTAPDMDPFFRPLVDELLQLHEGVVMYDAHKKEKFIMRAEVLATITDLPGGNKLHKTTHSGAHLHACYNCEQQGRTVKAYNRVLYLDNSRFLSSSPEPPPRRKTKEEVYHFGRAVQDFKDRMNEGDSAQLKVLTQMQKSTGKKGLEELSRLPYYDPISNRPPDPMHCTQVVMKKVHALINGHVNPRKTLEKERSLGRFTSSTEASVQDPDYSDLNGSTTPGKRKADQQSVGQKRANSHPPWALDKVGIETADKRCLHIKVPHGFGWLPRPFFRSLPYLKSHQWMKIGTRGILKYVLRELLGEQQLESLHKLLDCLRVICSQEISQRETQQLASMVPVALADMEKYWPLCLNSIMMHLHQHIADYLSKYGPAPSIWMFSFERCNQFMTTRIKKRDTPEVNMMETFRIFELSNLMQWLGELPPGALIIDPDAQLKAVTEARRELFSSSQPVTRTNASFEEEDHAQPSEDPEEEWEDQVDQEDQEDSSPSTDGFTMLTSQYRKPEAVQLTDHDVALISRATGTNAANIPREATRYFTAKLQRPRRQVVTCAMTDNPATSTCSSYIGMLSKSGSTQNCVKDLSGQSLHVNFGRVLYFIRLSLGTAQHHTELAMIQWLPVPVMRDGLWMVESSGVVCHSPSYVPCQMLPPPLVTAHDTLCPGTPLFFLDAVVSSMPQAPL